MTLDGLLVIETIKGTYFHGADKNIFVDGGMANEGRLVLPKKGRDVNIGDLVLIHAASLDIPLDQVKKDLDELDIEYYRARRTVMDITPEGTEIPFFRQYLITPLAKSTGIGEDRNKTLKIGKDDYSRDEYATMTTALSEILSDVPRQRLLSWMHGNEMSPRNWDIFNRLRDLNPTFGEIYDTIGQPGKFHDQYCLYVGANRVIRHQLLGIRETPEETHETDEKERPNGRNHEQRLKIIFDKYANRIDDKTLSVRVTNVSEAERRKRQSSGEGTHEGVFPRGLVNDWETRQNVAPFRDFAMQYTLLDLLVTEGISRFGYSRPEILKMGDWSRGQFKNLYDSIFVKLFNTPSKSELTWEIVERFGVGHLFASKSGAHVNLFFEEFKTAYLNGTLDASMNLPAGTWYQTVAGLQRSRAVLPRALFEFFCMNGIALITHKTYQGESKRTERRRVEGIYHKAQERSKKLKQYLDREYGIDTSSHLQTISSLANRFIAEGKMAPTPYGSIDHQRVIELASQHNRRIASKPEVVAVLERAGAPLAIHLSNPADGYV